MSTEILIVFLASLVKYALSRTITDPVKRAEVVRLARKMVYEVSEILVAIDEKEAKEALLNERE